jgi:hypothetical protein
LHDDLIGRLPENQQPMVLLLTVSRTSNGAPEGPREGNIMMERQKWEYIEAFMKTDG